jgi:hypothetical protein
MESQQLPPPMLTPTEQGPELRPEESSAVYYAETIVQEHLAELALTSGLPEHKQNFTARELQQLTWSALRFTNRDIRLGTIVYDLLTYSPNTP